MKRLAASIRLTLFLTLAGFCFGSAASLARDTAQTGWIDPVHLADMPAEAGRTLMLIKRGGPFPFTRKDGSAFGNFEKRLPLQPRGYYREYTVPTPGSRDRGARRIVAGSGRFGDVATAGEYYYTHDHYRTFRRIRE